MCLNFAHENFFYNIMYNRSVFTATIISLFSLFFVSCVEPVSSDGYEPRIRVDVGAYVPFLDLSRPAHNDYDHYFQKYALSGDTIIIKPEKNIVFQSYVPFDTLISFITIGNTIIPKDQLTVLPSQITFIIPQKCSSGKLRIISKTMDTARQNKGILYDTVGSYMLTVLEKDISIATFNEFSGRFIGFAQAGGSLYISAKSGAINRYNLSTGEVVEVTPAGFQALWVGGFQFSKDGKRVCFNAFINDEWFFITLNLETGALTKYDQSKWGSHFVVDPDRLLCYFVTPPEDTGQCKMHLIDLINKTEKIVQCAASLPVPVLVIFTPDGKQLIDLRMGVSYVYDVASLQMLKKVSNKLQYDLSGYYQLPTILYGRDRENVLLATELSVYRFTTLGLYLGGEFTAGTCIGSVTYATAGKSGCYIYDMQTGSQISMIEVPLSCDGVALSADDKYVAVSSGSKIKVYSVR